MKRSVLSILMCIVAFGMSYAQSNENVFTIQVGAYKVSQLPEGQGLGDSRILIGATPEMMATAIPDGTFPIGTNTFLIRTPEQTILVDAGYGKLLFDNLALLGVQPEEINTVLITHMHGDHIGGMLRDGKPAFPNATVYIATPEHAHWIAIEGGAKNVIEAYQGKFQLFQPEEAGKATSALLPGIYGIASYGHTPGHTSFLVESEGKQLLIWGDLTHAMAIQMPYPQVAVTYDTNPEQAIQYRKQLLEYVTANKMPIAGMHIAYPGIGNVTAAGTGYVFTPAK